MTFFPNVFKKVYPFFENIKMLFATQKGVLLFAFETHVHRLLLVLVGGFNFRLGTNNVPPESSAKPYGEARRAEFDGMGWMDGISKVSFNFLHNLWVYR